MPPQTIISVPVHTAVWAYAPEPGRCAPVEVGVQVSVDGVVAPAGVHERRRPSRSAPDDHLRPGPHGGVVLAPCGTFAPFEVSVQVSVDGL